MGAEGGGCSQGKSRVSFQKRGPGYTVFKNNPCPPSGGVFLVTLQSGASCLHLLPSLGIKHPLPDPGQARPEILDVGTNDTQAPTDVK